MEDRKRNHISLALKNQTGIREKDTRFLYEPMISGHPQGQLPVSNIGGKKTKAPIWISSMTGGTKQARRINHNLAGIASEFRLGMGLGSCHILIKNERHLPDFDLRPTLGDDLPFYANMGIAQIEQFIEKDDLQTLKDLIGLLKADGLIVHVNPLQEWLQPEGDHIKHPPIESIKNLLDAADFNIIVKEVGQGMGRESLSALLKLPLTAIEFGAFGGTNFTMMELTRNEDAKVGMLEPFSYIGQTAEEMTIMVNNLLDKKIPVKTGSLIISGGLKNFLDGYYLINLSKLPAVYGMASSFLKYARKDYKSLKQFTINQLEGLKMAYAYLKIYK